MKEIILKSGHISKVDDEDYSIIMENRWYVLKKKSGVIYARTTRGNKEVLMHRIIMGAISPMDQIDHKDGDGLNNQKNNLRPCNHSGNAKNRKPRGKSKYNGVFPRKNMRWEANINIGGKQKYLGLYQTEIEAAIAFNLVAIKTGDEFYRLNDI